MSQARMLGSIQGRWAKKKPARGGLLVTPRGPRTGAARIGAALRREWFQAEAEIFRGPLAHAQQWPTSARSYQPVRISAEINDVPLCGACYGCGLELAFPPVEAGGMGGWIAYWPHGQGGALVYRRTCRACEGLGVTEPAARAF